MQNGSLGKSAKQCCIIKPRMLYSFIHSWKGPWSLHFKYSTELHTNVPGWVVVSVYLDLWNNYCFFCQASSASTAPVMGKVGWLPQWTSSPNTMWTCWLETCVQSVSPTIIRSFESPFTRKYNYFVCQTQPVNLARYYCTISALSGQLLFDNL